MDNKLDNRDKRFSELFFKEDLMVKNLETLEFIGFSDQKQMTHHNLELTDFKTIEKNRCKICDEHSCYFLSARRHFHLWSISRIPKLRNDLGLLKILQDTGFRNVP